MALWKTNDGKKTIRRKIALWIGYAMLATVIVTSVMLINLRHRMAAAEAENSLMVERIGALQSANKSLYESFNTMVKLREFDSQRIADLGEGLSEQSVTHERVKNRLTKLENDNASVRQFLDTPRPVDFDVCLLDDSCAGNPDKDGVRHPAKAATGKVR